jgi:hypothetical protein
MEHLDGRPVMMLVSGSLFGDTSRPAVAVPYPRPAASSYSASISSLPSTMTTTGSSATSTTSTIPTQTQTSSSTLLASYQGYQLTPEQSIQQYQDFQQQIQQHLRQQRQRQQDSASKHENAVPDAERCSSTFEQQCQAPRSVELSPEYITTDATASDTTEQMDTEPVTSTTATSHLELFHHFNTAAAASVSTSVLQTSLPSYTSATEVSTSASAPCIKPPSAPTMPSLANNALTSAAIPTPTPVAVSSNDGHQWRQYGRKVRSQLMCSSHNCMQPIDHSSKQCTNQ